MRKKRTEIRKILLSAAMSLVLSSTVYANEKDIEDIINKYNLQDREEYIKQNSNEFLQYYEAVMQNDNLSTIDKEVALKDFWLIIEYCDLNEQIENVKEREIIIDNDFCENRNAEAVFLNGTDTIYEKTETSKEIKSHETKHHIFDHYPNNTNLYFYNEEISNEEKYTDVISIRAFNEAFSSDLSCQDYSLDGYTKSYPELNLCLQAIYSIFGREEILNIYGEDDFLYQMVKKMQEQNISTETILSFFKNFEYLRSHLIDKTPNNTFSKEEVIYEICLNIIDIYESSTTKAWEENLPMQSIIYSLLINTDLNTLNVKKDEQFKKLLEFQNSPDFLDINFQGIYNMQVLVESQNKNVKGELGIKYQKGVVEAWQEDTFYIEFSNDKIISQKNVNSFEQEFLQKLKEYGVKKEDVELYKENLSFYLVYESIINRNTLLNENEKKYYLAHLKDFITLHYELFERKENSSNVQFLFSNALKNSTTKKQIEWLFTNEIELYINGDRELIETLKEVGITAEQDIKFYGKNRLIFYDYMYSISNNPNIVFEKEKYIRLFPNFLENHPELTNLAEYDCTKYIYEQIGACRTSEELENIIYRHSLSRKKVK